MRSIDDLRRRNVMVAKKLGVVPFVRPVIGLYRR